MKDIYNALKVVGRMSAQAITTAGGAKDTGNVDLQGYESAIVSINVGTNGDTLDASNYVKVTLQHGDTTASYANVSSADVLGVMPSSGVIVTDNAAADDDATYTVGYIGGKRYVKATVTPVGTLSNGTPVGVDVLGSNARHQPVN